MTAIESLREEITALDRQLFALFARRMELSRMIAHEKKALGMPICDPGREKTVRENAQYAVGGVLAPYAAELSDTLMQLSREYQEKTIGK